MTGVARTSVSDGTVLVRNAAFVTTTCSRFQTTELVRGRSVKGGAREHGQGSPSKPVGMFAGYPGRSLSVPPLAVKFAVFEVASLETRQP